MMAERNTQIGKAVVKFRELSADERVRDTYFRREMMRRDIAAQNKQARQEGRQEGIFDVARNLLSMNLPLDQVVTATGLSRKDVESLRN